MCIDDYNDSKRLSARVTKSLCVCSCFSRLAGRRKSATSNWWAITHYYIMNSLPKQNAIHAWVWVNLMLWMWGNISRLSFLWTDFNEPWWTPTPNIWKRNSYIIKTNRNTQHTVCIILKAADKRSNTIFWTWTELSGLKHGSWWLWVIDDGKFLCTDQDVAFSKPNQYSKEKTNLKNKLRLHERFIGQPHRRAQ